MSKKHTNLLIIWLVFSVLMPEGYANRIIPTVHQHARIPYSLRSGFETRVQPSRDQFNSAVELTEFLQDQPGLVQLKQASVNPNELTINMRGFGDNANANHLLLINGFPYNYSTGSPNLNFLPLNSIEQIIFFSGSQGVRYGNGAVGGTVRVMTRTPTQNDVQWSTSVGNHNTHQMQNQFSWIISPGWYVQGWGQFLQKEGQRHWQERDQRVVGLQTGALFDQAAFKLQVMDYEYSSQLPGGLNASDYACCPDQANAKQNQISTHIRQLQLLHQWQLGVQHVLETRFWVEQQTASGKIGIPMMQDQQLSFLEWRLRGQHQQKKYEIGMLLQHQRYQFLSDTANQFANSDQFDVFAENEWPLLLRTQLTVGARYSSQWSHVRKNTWQPIDPRASVGVYELGLEHYFSPEWLVYVRRDGNFRYVKTNEIMWSSNVNANLQAQTGVSYESGVRYAHERGEVQLNAFHLTLKNEIAFNPEQEDAMGRYTNLSPTTRDGVMLHYAWQFHPRIRWQHDVRWILARFSGNQKRVPAQPEWANEFGLHFSVNDHLRLAYRLDYQGTRYASNDLDNRGGLQPSVVLQGVSLMLDQQPWHASLTVYNLFNKKYANYTTFTPASSSLTYFPGNGRSILLTIRITG